MIILTWGHSVVTVCRRLACPNSKIEGEWTHPGRVISVFRHLLTVLCGIALVAFGIMSELLIHSILFSFILFLKENVFLTQLLFLHCKTYIQ